MNKKQILRIGVLISFFGELCSFSSFAGPRVFSPKPPSIDHNRFEKSDRLNKNSYKMSLENLQRSQDEIKILSALQIERGEMKNLVREFKANSTEFTAFQSLLSSARKSSSNEDRALLKNYFQLLARTTGDFHLSPSRLEQQINSWSPFAKLQFSRVLETAIDISSQGGTPLREEVFESALKKFDLDREYLKKCKK